MDYTGCFYIGSDWNNFKNGLAEKNVDTLDSIRKYSSPNGDFFFQHAFMTQEFCYNVCDSNGFAYAGSIYG
jgi:hypothetical protein